MVFPRKKGGFALQDGVETTAPDVAEHAEHAAVDSSAAAFPVGFEVEVVGLTSATELNGRTGTVVEPPMLLTEGRVTVLVGVLSGACQWSPRSK